jgi:hypothetical protein
MGDLSDLREDAGDQAGAEQLAREAANAGYSHGLRDLAQKRFEAGEEWWGQILRFGLEPDGRPSPSPTLQE